MLVSCTTRPVYVAYSTFDLEFGAQAVEMFASLIAGWYRYSEVYRHPGEYFVCEMQMDLLPFRVAHFSKDKRTLFPN